LTPRREPAALDRYVVHRLRMVTGKDGNPLNEVEMLCDSLMNNNGILRSSNEVFSPGFDDLSGAVV
jgi:hypothetical protein